MPQLNLWVDLSSVFFVHNAEQTLRTEFQSFRRR
jgi:hypothetical protein